MSERRIEAPTFRYFLNFLKGARDAGEETINTPRWEKVIGRLEIVEGAVPSWMDFEQAIHPLWGALDTWNSSEFAILIGRAVVYPKELGWDGQFQTPQQLWEFASMGLGGTQKTAGRQSKLSREQQIQVYDLASKAQIPYEQLAEMYEVSIKTIQRIVKKWQKELEGYGI